MKISYIILLVVIIQISNLYFEFLKEPMYTPEQAVKLLNMDSQNNMVIVRDGDMNIAYYTMTKPR